MRTVKEIVENCAVLEPEDREAGERVAKDVIAELVMRINQGFSDGEPTVQIFNSLQAYLHKQLSIVPIGKPKRSRSL